MDCPAAEDLVRLAQGEEPAPGRKALLTHLEGCGECRLEAALAVESLRGRARAWRLAAPLAAAALLLLAVSLWGLLRERGGEPLPLATPSPVLRLSVLPVSSEAKAPRWVWLGPGSRMQVREGSVTRVAEGRLSLPEGEIWIEHRGGGALEVQTPAGFVIVKESLVARLRCGERPAAAAWLRSAEAASPVGVVMEVEEGQAEFRTGEATLPLRAGDRLSVSPGRAPRVERFSPPAPQGPQVWKGEALRALLGVAALELQGGPEGRLWNLPLPCAQAYQVEIEARLMDPAAHLGLVAPVGGATRIWQLSGMDCPPGSPHTVSLTVLGASASGSVDGHWRWTAPDALKTLRPAGPQAGLRVWGEVEVLELRIRTWEQKGENHGP